MPGGPHLLKAVLAEDLHAGAQAGERFELQRAYLIRPPRPARPRRFAT
jgi:hypothetical protein